MAKEPCSFSAKSCRVQCKAAATHGLGKLYNWLRCNTWKASAAQSHWPHFMCLMAPQWGVRGGEKGALLAGMA